MATDQSTEAPTQQPAQPRVEWWATSAGTVPVQVTPQPDGTRDVRAWDGITIWEGE